MGRRQHFDLGHGKPQFEMEYDFDELDPEDRHRIYVHPYGKEETIGSMYWSGEEGRSEGTLNSIDVDPRFQRQGIATRMWQYARDLSNQDPSIHYIVPSNFRTRDGDAWAHALHRRGLSGPPPANQHPEDED
jgi:ribosomal protein S18 acetylase RimI-like enzyme